MVKVMFKASIATLASLILLDSISIASATAYSTTNSGGLRGYSVDKVVSFGNANGIYVAETSHVHSDNENNNDNNGNDNEEQLGSVPVNPNGGYSKDIQRTGANISRNCIPGSPHCPSEKASTQSPPIRIPIGTQFRQIIYSHLGYQQS